MRKSRVPPLVLAAVAASGVYLLAGERPVSDESRAIRKVLDDQVAAWNKGDLVAFMAGYRKVPELTFYSGKDKRQGWDETLERYRKRYQGEGKEMGTLAFSELEIQELSDRYALVKGRWEVKTTREKLNGLFTLVFFKTPDGWRIVHDHTSG